MQNPHVQIIQINEQLPGKKQKNVLRTYAIVQIPENQKSIIISFDKFCSPYFQGLNQYDVFDENSAAFETIKSWNEKSPEKVADGIAIAGMIKNSLNKYFLLLIKEADPFIFHDEIVFYKIKSFITISLNSQEINTYDVKEYYYSFNYNIISFREHKNNKNYNFFNLIQKPFRRLQTNVCPFVINGHITSHSFSKNLEILLICRRSATPKKNENNSDINSDGTTFNQSEIEVVFYENKYDGLEISYFTATFGGIPFSYAGEGGEISFNEAPKLVFNLLGNSEEKIENEVFLIDASNDGKFGIEMRKIVSFLSGVFRTHYLPINVSSEFSKYELFQCVYSNLPEIKLAKIFIKDNNAYYLSESSQVFYTCSKNQNFSAEFVTALLICKAFNSFKMNRESIETEVFMMLSPFLQHLNDPKKYEFGVFSDFFDIRPNINSNNEIINSILSLSLSLKQNAANEFNAFKSMERCVSLFPTATVVDPIDVDHRILSLNDSFPYFYQTPEKPVIISLSEVCRISSIKLNFPQKENKKSNIFNILPSTVSVYGGLRLNQMFPIVENLAISWTVETSFLIDSADTKYSTNLKYTKYGKVLFLAFFFKSPFKAFYLPNIQVYTNGQETFELPKKVRNEKLVPIEIGGNIKYIESECRRIIDDESISVFICRNQDKIQDLIDVNCYFKKSEHINQMFFKKFDFFNSTLTRNEEIMMARKFPFLLKKLKMKSNLIKGYCSNEMFIPAILASGPPLFEYVIGQNTDLSNFTAFEPKSNVILVKLVLLQSYNVDSIEVHCDHPLLFEILNNNYTFLPPGGRQKLPQTDKRVFDIKIIGNPISISFLRFVPQKIKITFENDSILEKESTPANESSSIIINGKESKANFFSNSQIEIKGPPKKIIGMKLDLPRKISPRFLLFGNDHLPISVMANPDAAFFLPEIISCNKIRIICQGTYPNQKLNFNASFFEVHEEQENKKSSFSDVVEMKPSQILFTNK